MQRLTLNDLNLLDIGHTIHMSGVIYEGNGKTFLIPFPKDLLASSLMNVDADDVKLLDMERKDWDIFLRQTDLLDVEVLVRDPDGTIGKAIVRKSQRQIEQTTSWTVFRRDNYTCRYCGKNDLPLTVDHLVLWEEGGPSTLENLVSACRKCNKTRGNLEYNAWLRHPYYQKASKALPREVREANEELVKGLDKIPRRIQPRSR